MAIEHRVGVHDISFAPGDLFSHPSKLSSQISETGADFWVHMPGWRDLIVSNRTFKQLSFKPEFIDDSWWIDRAVEIVTPLSDPVSAMGQAKNILTSVAYPIPPFAKFLTQRELSVFPESGLIRRWPIVEQNDVPLNLAKRNKILQMMSSRIAPKREVLDVHSINLGLNPEQILEWQKQKPGRRLMISALAIDERLDKYSLDLPEQYGLIKRLIPYVSVVTLKLEQLRDKDGNIVMSRDGVLDSIVKGNKNNEYARRIKALSEVVGSQIKKPIEWVIKVKSSADSSIVPRFIEYAKRIIN